MLVGAGKMGGAMLSGWMERGVDPSSVVVLDPRLEADMSAYLKKHGVRHISELPEIFSPAVILLAVKPQMMDAVLPAVAPAVVSDTLVLSVAAGTRLARFEALFGAIPIVRVMPNTPSQVGRGMSVACPNAQVIPVHRETVDELMRAIGDAAWIEDEDLMDAVTGVSGSGPAYVFYLAEALAKAGEEAGLPAELAAQLARQTVAGAGELLYRSELSPEVLRQNVTSPNGTTAAALNVLMADDGVQPVLTKAVQAAADRSRELSE